MEFIVASTAEPEEILTYVDQIKMKALQSGRFAFPPIIDTKIDQPQTEFNIDRDMVSSLGLDLRDVMPTWDPSLAAITSIDSTSMAAVTR